MEDSALEAARQDLIFSFIGAEETFKKSISQSVTVAKKGFKVSKDYVFLLDKIIKGELDSRDVADMVSTITHGIDKLLKDAHGLQETFDMSRDALEVVCFSLSLHMPSLKEVVVATVSSTCRGDQKSRRLVHS